MTRLLFIVCALSQSGVADYRWPLDARQELTSSFGEYRTGRFHAGIDLRAAVGQPVYAPADGYVTRVRCGPWGYGKAVYVQFESGYNAVFAHLNDYNDGLRSYVRTAQHAAQNYSVELTPTAKMFPVRKGELLAFTGQTGTGAPHLHFEYRDSSQRPINPQLIGITWPDHTRPVIRKVLVAPAGPASRVNGDILPVVLEAQAHGEGQYKTSAIRVRGKIGFGVDVLDPASGGSKLGVHTLRLACGESEIFRIQHDLLSYENLRNAEVSYHPYFLEEGLFLALWRWPGNECASYAVSPGDGWWTAASTPVEIRIEAKDFMGNMATLIIPVQPEEPPATEKKTAVPAAGRGEATLECYGNYMVVTAHFTASEPDAPQLTIEADTEMQSPAFHRVNTQTFRAGFLPEASGAYTFRATHPRMKAFEEIVHAILRGEPARTVDLGGVTLKTKPNSAYGVLFARMWTAPDNSAPGLMPLSDYYRIWPGESPIDAEAELVFAEPASLTQPEQVHVYRKSGGAWTRLDTRRHAGTLTVATRRFGTFAIMRDSAAPELSIVPAAKEAKSAATRPILQASVTDKGSGVAKAEIYCDKQWLLTAYDPERGRMVWEGDEDLSSGPHTITFRAGDASGNIVERTKKIVIP